MSEANCQIASCIPNREQIYSSFPGPFSQSSDSSVNTANGYLDPITGKYRAVQEYPMQGSSSEMIGITDACKVGNFIDQNTGSWGSG